MARGALAHHLKCCTAWNAAEDNFVKKPDMERVKQLILWTVKQLDQLTLTRPLCKLNRPMTHSRLLFAGSIVPLESDRNGLKILMSSQFLSLPISMTNQFSYIMNHFLLGLLFTSVCINKVTGVSQTLLKKSIFLLLL